MLASVTPQQFWTFCLMAGLVWMAITRYGTGLDRGLPLLVWLGAVMYNRYFDFVLPPLALWVGIALALSLRFEFMGGWFVKVTRFAESVLIAFVLIRCVTLLRGW